MRLELKLRLKFEVEVGGDGRLKLELKLRFEVEVDGDDRSWLGVAVPLR